MVDVGFSRAVWWEIFVFIFTCFTADVDDQTAGVLPILRKGGSYLELKNLFDICLLSLCYLCSSCGMSS